jgi:hypothetical protein
MKKKEIRCPNCDLAFFPSDGAQCPQCDFDLSDIKGNPGSSKKSKAFTKQKKHRQKGGASLFFVALLALLACGMAGYVYFRLDLLVNETSELKNSVTAMLARISRLENGRPISQTGGNAPERVAETATKTTSLPPVPAPASKPSQKKDGSAAGLAQAVTGSNTEPLVVRRKIPKMAQTVKTPTPMAPAAIGKSVPKTSAAKVISPPKQAGTAASADQQDLDFWIYRMKATDTLDLIAKTFYGSAEYYPVILLTNTHVSMKTPPAGLKIKLLKNQSDVHKIYNQKTRTIAKRRYLYYTVAAGETKASLAARFSKSSEGEKQLAILNPDTKFLPGDEITIRLE